MVRVTGILEQLTTDVPGINVSVKDLSTSVSSILQGQQPPLSYHKISEQGHQLVVRGDDTLTTLYTKINVELQAYVSRIVRDSRAFLMAREKNWLGKLLATWKEYSDRVVSCPIVCHES